MQSWGTGIDKGRVRGRAGLGAQVRGRGRGRARGRAGVGAGLGLEGARSKLAGGPSRWHGSAARRGRDALTRRRPLQQLGLLLLRQQGGLG